MHDTTGARRESGALSRALDQVGDRWSLLLVEALLDGSRRYGELAEAVPGIAPNVLADRLRRLVAAGVLGATPYTTRPPRLEYALTADGRELAGVVRLLTDWGARRSPGLEQLRHTARGALVLPDLRPGGGRRRGRSPRRGLTGTHPAGAASERRAQRRVETDPVSRRRGVSAGREAPAGCPLR